jgi:hypothetical protein
MITKSKEEQIQINLEDLNLKLVHKVMKQLNWTWKDYKSNDRRVPSEEELAIVAKDCMDKAWNSEKSFSRIGGFEAEVIEGVIDIKFVLTQANPLSNLLG